MRADEDTIPPPIAAMAYNVLFLCTANSARSIMAEALLNALGGGRFRAFSAGSRASGTVNPLALEALERGGYPTGGLRSKSWDEFAASAAPPIDFVITVCDNAAAEACPVFPGRPVSAHWGVPDPAAVRGGELERRAAFAATLSVLRRRVQELTSLPFDSVDKLALRGILRDIGGR
jgi:arsenate reductase (thioredoxin)